MTHTFFYDENVGIKLKNVFFTIDTREVLRKCISELCCPFNYHIQPPPLSVKLCKYDKLMKYDLYNLS